MRKFTFYISMTSCFLLASCGGGLNLSTRHSPDEFAVLPQTKNISYPTQYELIEPSELKKQANKNTPAEMAKSIITNSASQTNVNSVNLEQDALLSQLTQSGSTPNIRTVLEEESVEQGENITPLGRKLLFWKKDPKEVRGVIVNAEEEAKRIQENLETGKPVTEGETPKIEEDTGNILQ